MNAPDFAALVADALSTAYLKSPLMTGWQEDADKVLTTKVSAACPDCRGSGWTDNPALEMPIQPCAHPSAPTIGTLLAYGFNVARCVPTVGFGSEGYVNAVGEGTCFRPIELLDALRTIELAP